MGGPTLISRNLTSVFTKYRQQRLSQKGRVDGLPAQRLLDGDGSGSGDIAIEMSSLPPQWVDVAEEARQDIKGVNDKLVQLQKAQNKRLLKVFGDDGAPDKDVQAISSEIGALIRRCEQTIHNFKSHGGPSTGAEREFRHNVQRNLATQLQGLSQQFRQAQKEYLNEIRKRQRGAIWDDVPSQGNGKAADVGFNESQLLELDSMETTASQRSQEICQIASSINDLHTVFKELAVLVIDQGSILDRIDYNIDQVVDQSREANTQLQKAEKSQKSNRAMKCLIFLVIANAILIFIMILKARH